MNTILTKILNNLFAQTKVVTTPPNTIINEAPHMDAIKELLAHLDILKEAALRDEHVIADLLSKNSQLTTVLAAANKANDELNAAAAIALGKAKEVRS